MQFIILFAAVLVTAQAAQIPPEATVHQVLVPVPINVLAPPLPEHVENVQPAVVTEVSKDHTHKPVIEPAITNSLALVQAKEDMVDITTIMTTTPQTSETKTTRQIRAVPFTDMDNVKPPQLVTDVNVIKNILNQRKANRMTTNIPPRFMRSVEQETIMTPESITVKSTDATLINPCDLLCTKFEFDPICSTNGLCLHEFPNQCILDTYNCKHPMQKFSATKDDRCQMHWLTKCNAEELF